MSRYAKIIISVAAVGGLVFGLLYPSKPKQKIAEGPTERVTANQVLVLLRNAVLRYTAENKRTPRTLRDIMDLEAESTLGVHTTFGRLTAEVYPERLPVHYILEQRDSLQPIRDDEPIAYVSLQDGGVIVIFGDGHSETCTAVPTTGPM